MTNEKDPNFIFTLGDKIKTDTQAIDYISYLINCQQAPIDLEDPEEVKQLNDLVSEIAVILCYVRDDKNSCMEEDEAESLVNALLGKEAEDA